MSEFALMSANFALMRANSVVLNGPRQVENSKIKFMFLIVLSDTYRSG